MGEDAYGDASLRRAITMGDAWDIIMLEAKYYSPSVKAIQGNGVTMGTMMMEPETEVDVDENGESCRTGRIRWSRRRSWREDPLYKKVLELLSAKA